MVNTATKNMNTIHADVAFFTPAAKPMLDRFDSSEDCRRAPGNSVKTQLGFRETRFITGRDSFYVAAIGEDRWAYTQRHHGPKGFLCVLDPALLAFASLASSRRYISPGKAVLFLLDHILHARMKIWVDAEVSQDLAIKEKLAKTCGHTQATHLAFLFHVRAFDWNYEKHAVRRSVDRGQSTEPVRRRKSDPISRKDSNRCLSLDAGSGVWTLNAHGSSPTQIHQPLC